MFADRGLQPSQISGLFIVWSLTSFILQVPTGPLADKFSRKTILVIAEFIRAIGYALWLIMPNYWGFLVGFLLWGIKSALAGGTLESLIYDELSSIKQQSRYTEIIGKQQSFGLLGVIAAGFGATLLARYGYGLVLILSVVAVLAAALLAMLLPNARTAQSVQHLSYLYHFKSGIRIVTRQPAILWLVLASAIVIGFASIDEFFGLFFKERGLNNTMISFWSAIEATFGIVGGWFAHKLERKSFNNGILMLIWSCVLFTATVLPPTAAPIAISLFAFFFMLQSVLLSGALQHRINGESRATTTSIQELIVEFAAICAFIGYGIAAGYLRNSGAMRVMAAGILIAAILFGLTSRSMAVRE